MNKTLYQIELYLSKYLPIVIALIYLCNTLGSYYYKEICECSFLGGVSILILIRLYINSYAYKLCEHHRIFLHYITIHNLLDYIDYYMDGIPITSKENLLLEIVLFGCALFLYILFKRYYDFSVKNGSKIPKRYCQ